MGRRAGKEVEVFRQEGGGVVEEKILKEAEEGDGRRKAEMGKGRVPPLSVSLSFVNRQSSLSRFFSTTTEITRKLKRFHFPLLRFTR